MVRLAATLITLIAIPALAQTKKVRPFSDPPSRDSLSAISRRGRALAELDRIAWLGGAAMTSLSLPEDSVRRLIARKTVRGWEVASGTLSESGDALLITDLSTPGMQSQWASSTYNPPRPDTGYYARAGRAIETALTMFVPIAQRPYIATAVPAADGPWWWVYVYPAPRKAGVWPRGGDTRFRVSADGRVITETRHLHETITDYSALTARSVTAASADRVSLVTGNAPEDTDVFHVIQRRPALPEIMTAGRFQYRIDVDGGIRLIRVRE